jgi:integrase
VYCHSFPASCCEWCWLRLVKLAPADVKQLRYEDIRDSYFKHKPNAKNYRGMPALDDFFAGKRVTRIDTNLLEDFIESRREEDTADATIRRNLNPLRAMFRYALKKKQLGLHDVPYFPMPEDSAAAGTYITPEQFVQIRSHLPKSLRLFFTFLYGTACRLGAAQKITWDTVVGTDCARISVPSANTKSGEPLPIVLVGAFLGPVAQELARIRREYKKSHFQDPSGVVFDSTNYRTEWSKAVAKAKLGTFDPETRRRTGVRIHDCRCSAAINLIDSGVDEGTVLKIGGWKTRAMLDRYNVLNEKRIQTAQERAGKYVAAKIASAS